MIRMGEIWSPARVKQLSRLWLEGHSISVISKTMDCGFSRNAIVGKAHRLGLPRRGRRYKPASRKKYTPRHDTPRDAYFWSHEAIDKLAVLWPQNLHWTEIRDQIDPDLTAKAIKYKAGNLGLKRDFVTASCGPLEVDLTNPPFEERKTFTQIGLGDCKYPIGDPLNLDFAYCARKATHGPYCESHHIMCHAPRGMKRAVA